MKCLIKQTVGLEWTWAMAQKGKLEMPLTLFVSKAKSGLNFNLIN